MNNDFEKISYDKFPPDFKLLPVWVPFKTRIDSGVATFEPIDIRGGGLATMYSPSSLTTFARALHYANTRRAKFKHLGFALMDGLDVFVARFKLGPNLEISHEDRETIEALKSYTEISHTGNYLTVVGYGCLGTDVLENKATGMEFKGRNHFVIITGNVFSDLPIRDCQAELNQMKSEGVLKQSHGWFKERESKSKLKFQSVGRRYAPTGS